MSKTIDERVVSMRFDNKHFETNVKTTMSTLDKLKKSLKLDGASKGLENIDKTAKKVNMSNLGSSVETVRAKFSALEVMGVTALANITNSAVNAAKRISSALFIEPVTTGFNEYELKMNSVKTIMASTGEDINTVNKYLEELNKYSDQTIYSFSDMTQNIGKFTNAGVKLEDAVLAIKGISNEAAVSGANANEASRAMYNFAQALSVGYIQRIDWKSIELANMATVEFKEQLLNSAIAMGTVKKAADGTYATLANPDKFYNSAAMFTETLDDQWLTTEVLINTLKDYSDETTVIGKKAYKAAQEVTTLTQMFSVLKETAQSGWAKTWELMLGNLIEAKTKVFTPLSNFFSGIIDKMSNFRNAVLESALTRGFKDLASKINAVTEPAKNAVKVVKNLGDIVNKVIRGDFGNGRYRIEAMTKAGHNYYAVQNKVNEQLGYTFRYSDKVVEAQDKLLGTQSKNTEQTVELTKANVKQIETLVEMSDAELKLLGYTEDQIQALRELKKMAEKTGIPLKEFIENIDKIDGRYLLINSFKNAGQGLVAVFTAIGDAWKEIFNINVETVSDKLFNFIAGLHKFSTYLRVSEEAADKFKRTFKGVFAAIDIALTIIGGPIKIVFKILKQLLSAFDLDILSITAVIGDAIVKFRDWLDSVLDFTGVFKWIAPYIQDAISAVRKWIDAIKPMEKIATVFKKAAEAISDFVKSVWETDIVQNIINGLANGLKNGATTVWNAIVDMAKGMLTKIKSVLGIHSPSTEFQEVGENAVKGLANGLKSGVGSIVDIIKTLCSKMFNAFGNIDWSNLSTIFTNIARLFPQLKIFTYISALGNIFAVAGKDVASGFVNGIGSSASAIWEAITNIASNIITKFKEILGIHSPSKVFFAIGGFLIAGLVGGLMGGTGGLFDALKTIGQNMIDFVKNLDLGTVIVTGIGIGAILMVKKTLDIIKDFASASKGIGKLTSSLGNLVTTINDGLVGKFKPSKWTTISNAILKVAIAIGILVAAVIAMSMVDSGKLWGAIGALGVIVVVVAALAGVMVGIMAATKLISKGENVDNIGGVLLKIAAAMAIMIIVAKMAAKLSPAALTQGTIAIVAFSGIMIALMTATKLINGSRNVDKIGGTLIKIAVAIGIMMLVAKTAAKMTPAELVQGALAMVAFSGIIVGLMAATKLMNSGKNVGKTILMIAGAIAAMALSVALLTLIKPEKLVVATLALSLLMGMFALVVKSTKNITKAMGTLVVLTVAIGLLAGALAIIAQSPWEQTLVAAGSLSLLMLVLSGIVVGLSKIKTNIKNVGLGVLGLLAVMAPLYALVGALALMSSVQNAMVNAQALSSLATTLTLLLIPLSVIGLFVYATQGIILLGVVALLAMMLPLYALIGALAIMSCISNAEANTTLLINLMTTMTDMLIKLAIVGPLALIGVTALTALTSLIIGVGLLAVGIGALMEKFPVLQAFVDTGISVLIQLAGGLGEMIGAFVGGIATQIAAALPGIGLALSQFIINTTPFITGIKMVDESVLKGVGILAAAIIALSVAEFINGIASLSPFTGSLADLGTQLSLFIMNATPFIVGAAAINPESINGIKTLAEAIIILTGANILEGIGKFITGESSLATFGSQLGQLGTDLRTFVDNLGTFNEDQVVTVGCAGRAIKALADAASTLPNEGGWVAAILGDNSIASFGSYLPQLGTDMASFVANLGTFDESKVTTVDCAGRAIKALAEAAAELPNEGGWAAAILGDNSISTFGSKLPQLGTDLSGFITNLGTFNEDSIATVDCAGRAIKALAEAAKTIPIEGGFWAKIVGDNSLATFGSKLPPLGSDIASFVSNLGTFGPEQISTVDAACGAIKSIARLGEIDLSDTSSGMDKLGKKLKSFAEKLAGFVSAIGKVGADSITVAVDKTKSLIELAKTAASTNVESLKTFGTSLKEVATEGVKGFVKAFASEDPVAKIKEAATTLMDTFSKDVTDKKDDINGKFQEVGESAATAIASQSIKDSFYQAGEDFGSGLVNGINAKKQAVYDAAYALGQKAVQGEKDGQASNSPSKLTIMAGKWLGEGLIIGIDKMGNQVYKAGSNLGKTATGTISSAISKVADAVNNDIDAQPTIRPVLDLSDVESGASAIGGMLSGRRTLSVSAAGIGAISASMAGYQNGSGDVVSAIDKLRKDLGNVGNTTYSINGITYDDGSNINDAVKTLVRAARMERRT